MAVWKARTGGTVRAYFKAVRNGNLVVGIPAGNFNCLLINPGDSANVALAVTQSAQQAGVYYVDLPAAFLTAHGVGHYGLSIGIHKPAPVPVDDERLDSVEVNVLDLDYIAGAVWDEARAAHVIPGTFGEGVNLTAAERTAVATALLDLANGVETNWTPREALRIILSSAAAKTRDFQLNTPKFRDINDTKDRITAAQDANGNRTAVAFDKV